MAPYDLLGAKANIEIVFGVNMSEANNVARLHVEQPDDTCGNVDAP